MAGRVWNVQIWHPGAPAGDAGRYWDRGEGGRLASLYGELLGMERIDVGYKKLVHRDGHLPEIGFESGRDDRRARWPDPEFPQQVHLDLEVGDPDEAETVALGHGAACLAGFDDHRVLSDPVGHPFCLYPDGTGGPLPGRLARIVIDCYSPRALSAFYAGVLEWPVRVVDTPARVVLSDEARSLPMLAFHHAVFPASRWPDPDHPAQIHLDLGFDELPAAHDLIERLGGMPLRHTPYHSVYGDPAGHPFCVGGTGPTGPDQAGA